MWLTIIGHSDGEGDLLRLCHSNEQHSLLWRESQPIMGTKQKIIRQRQKNRLIDETLGIVLRNSFGVVENVFSASCHSAPF